MDTSADIALVEAMEQGVPAAWTQAYTTYNANLLSFLSTHPTLEVRYGHTAEDLLQECWIQIPKRLHKYNGKAPLGYWLRMEMRWMLGALYRRRKDNVWQSAVAQDAAPEEAHQDTPEEMYMQYQLMNACNWLQKLSVSDYRCTDSKYAQYHAKARYRRYVNNWMNR